ncbi:hypothetical protein [Chitinophaga sp. Cy-1792]|uniref:hypothetical protein n=1 Tax=Chitinophaga sp. Cy-1792 TaxID=2608339 RepID=UPI00141ECC88|nr:hypothetical protein [Chitinophaga sp. Cy-1792]NIG53357.1 hypothetical protein [Chitinophaga sp. Cy-1792]
MSRKYSLLLPLFFLLFFITAAAYYFSPQQRLRRQARIWKMRTEEAAREKARKNADSTQLPYSKIPNKK